jgi:hypothetical protein
MSERLGWVFCEIAFRGWDGLPDSAYHDDALGRPRWWSWPAHAVLSASYSLGCWFYGRTL